MRYRGIILACLAILFGGPAWAEDKPVPLPEPVEVSGFKLGMTLEEFRAVLYPDRNRAQARAFCSGDPLPAGRERYFSVEPDSTLKGTGIIICRFYASRTDGNLVFWDETGLTIGKAGPLPTAFLFTPTTDDPATSHRLFRISVRAYVSEYDDLLAELQHRYGPPHWISQDHVESAAGQSYDDPGYVWENNRSQVVLTKRVMRVELSRVTFSDRMLLRVMGRLLHNQQLPANSIDTSPSH